MYGISLSNSSFYMSPCKLKQAASKSNLLVVSEKHIKYAQQSIAGETKKARPHPGRFIMTKNFPALVTGSRSSTTLHISGTIAVSSCANAWLPGLGLPKRYACKQQHSWFIQCADALPLRTSQGARYNGLELKAQC